MQKTRFPGKHIKITFEAIDENGQCVGMREHVVNATILSNSRIMILPMEADKAARIFWEESVQMGFLD